MKKSVINKYTRKDGTVVTITACVSDLHNKKSKEEIQKYFEKYFKELDEDKD